MKLEVVLGTFVICFKSKQEAWDADYQGIYIGHFERRKWIAKIYENVDYAKDCCEDCFIQE